MTSEYLLVDGYNVINTWPELRELGNLEHARARLVELLASYGAFRGAEPVREALHQFRPGQEFDFFQIRGYGVGRFQLVEAVSVTGLGQICIIS